MCYLRCDSVRALIVLFVISYNLVSSLTVADKDLLPLVKNSVGIQFYIDFENQKRVDTCKVYFIHKKCCILDNEYNGCVPLDTYSSHSEIISPRDRKTILFVAPMLHQHDVQGFCDFNLSYRCNTHQDNLQVNIPFDTSITKRSKRLLKDYLQGNRRKHCASLDQDSLDDCTPVNCDLKYHGYKSYYDNRWNKCVSAPACIRDFDKEIPDIVYVPDVNICRDLDMPVTVPDIYAITTGLGIITQPTTIEDVDYIEAMSNCSTISQNVNIINDLLHGKLCPCDGQTLVDLSGCCKSALLRIIFCIISVTVVLLSFICCINVSVKLYTQWRDGKIQNVWTRIRSRFQSKMECGQKKSNIDKEIRNALLKDVIVRDIPIELRESVVNVCDRMDKEVRKKKRYRDTDVGSQISLMRDKDSICPTTSDSEG